MSLLPSGTYASPLNPYYSAGGGPAPPANLDSPVTVVPNVGDGSATLVCPAEAGSVAALILGQQGSSPWSVNVNAAAATNLRVQYNDGATNPVYITVDDTVDSVGLGSGVAGGTVKSFNKFEVSDLSIVGTNVIRIAATSATAGQITNTVAAGGTLEFGSSAANSATMTLTDTATTLTKLGGAPQVLSGAPQTIVPAGSALVSLPAGEGLYAIVACGVGGTATGQTRQAQLSCFCYINSGGLCQMGGSATTDVGALASTDNVTLQVNPAGTAMNVYNNSAQSLVAYQVQAFKISGPIPGAV